MFLDRSWPIRGGAADISRKTHLTNRNKIKSYNAVFYSYNRKKGLS